MPKVPSIPENAPFTAAQRIWLNGFLAGLFAQNDVESGLGASEAGPQSSVPLLILFGSQTGTAEGLARRVATEATKRGFKPQVMEANAAPKLEWKAENRMLVITSTYGDGDMPDNAQGFWDWLQTEDAKKLAHISYTVLALGDTHNEQFCAAGKKIDAQIKRRPA